MAHYLVDGLNVCKWRSDADPPTLGPLLSLLVGLKRKGHTFLCVFDPQTRFQMEQAGEGPFFQKLTTEFPTLFKAITGGATADQFLIALATENKTPIISNDRFRDHIPNHPWLKRPPLGRLLKGAVLDDSLVVVGLDLVVADSRDITALCAELSGASPQSPGPGPKPGAARPGNKTAHGGRRSPSAPGNGSQQSSQPPFANPVPPPPRPQRKAASPSVPPPQRPQQPPRNPPPPPRQQPAQGNSPRPSTGIRISEQEALTQLLELKLLSEETYRILSTTASSAPLTMDLDANRYGACVLLIDKSLSIELRGLTQAIISGQNDLITALGGVDSSLKILLAQLLFDNEIHVFQPVVPLRERDTKKLSVDVKRLTTGNYKPGGGTAMRDSILKALTTLAPTWARSAVTGAQVESRIIVITDGMDEHSILTKKQLSDALEVMRAKGLVNDVVMLGIGNFDFKREAVDCGIRPDSVLTSTAEAKEVRRIIGWLSNMAVDRAAMRV